MQRENRFVMAKYFCYIYFGGAREFGGDWGALCGSQPLCSQSEGNLERTTVSFRPQ